MIGAGAQRRGTSKQWDFLCSALTEQNPHISTADFLGRLAQRREQNAYQVRRAPLEAMSGWRFDVASGNLVHESGKFFSIEGIQVEASHGPTRQWAQPILIQPEIGILGILTKKFGGVLHFLMQLKMEPGNLGLVQVSPTVQATRSNYSRVHKGASPHYLEYFLDRSRGRILVDQLQSEQGARFLRKRNRNIIIEVDEDVPVLENFFWLTLGQLNRLLRLDNVVNMDSRSVLAGIDFAVPEVDPGWDSAGAVLAQLEPFKAAVLRSSVETRSALHSSDEIISWFTDLKTRYLLDVRPMPLAQVPDWRRSEFDISHVDGKYFSVIGVSVQAGDREVRRWDQPMILPQQEGIIAFIAKPIRGVLHFLVQAKLEPGNHDVLEMAPTVQCITGSYKAASEKDRPAFLHDILNAPPTAIRYSALQSEEGGRFYQEQNRNMIVEFDETFGADVPENYVWMTLGQMNEFVRHNNYFNVQARSLIACMSIPEASWN